MSKQLTLVPKGLKPDQFTMVEEMREEILRPTPLVFIKQKPGRGGKSLNYVEGGYIKSRLRAIFGFNWTFESNLVAPMADMIKAKEIIVHGRLSIRDPQSGEILCVHEQFGTSPLDTHNYEDKKGNYKKGDPVSIGDDMKSAATDALKKCAADLGIAMDVYEPKIWQNLARTTRNAPLATNGGKTREGLPVGTKGEKGRTTPNDKQVRALLHAVENAKIEMKDIWAFMDKSFKTKKFKELNMIQYEKVLQFIADKAYK